MKLTRYLKAAFVNRWNLLGFIGGMAFALISGRPDIIAPLVLAGEVGYLGLLGTHPKFQAYVNAQEAKALRIQRNESSEQAVDRIIRELPQESRRRFDSLRARCLSLRKIAHDMKQPGASGSAGALDSLQLEGLDRLLWVFLRLLFTQFSLSRFLTETDESSIHDDIQRIEQRLAKVGEKKGTFKEKVRHALEDNLRTCRDRLSNYEKAKDNCEFVELEIDRLENKIKSLAEIAINRQEPDYISSQIDQVADSILDTEKTMNDLDFATGLGHLETEAPELLRESVQVTQ